MIHRHHRKLRRGKDERPVNLIGLPDVIHRWVHDNPEKAYEAGLLVRQDDDPAEIMVTIPEEALAGTKKRKPREPSRFKKVYSVRAPVDAGENGIEILEELIQACREKHAPALGWGEDVGDYFVLTAVLARDLTS